MGRYRITPASDRVPAVVLAATDASKLADQIALHFAKYRHLNKTVDYGLRLDKAGRGLITQRGLPAPLAFTITKEG